MYTKTNRPYTFSFLLFLVLCLGVPQGIFAATPKPSQSGFTLQLYPKKHAEWPDWRPRPNEKVTFVAELKGKDTTQSLSDITYTFTLSNVSAWPGYCMNMGENTDTTPDVKFDTDQPTVEGVQYLPDPPQYLTLKVRCTKPVTSVSVVVRVLDYGAIATLTATVNKRTTGKPAQLAIPKDDNGNDIADGWHNDATQNYAPWADAETGPAGNTFVGDGLTVFEEYRGFMVSGTSTGGTTGSSPDTSIQKRQKRLQLNRKDVFVHSEFAPIFYFSLPADDKP